MWYFTPDLVNTREMSKKTWDKVNVSLVIKTATGVVQWSYMH